MQWELSNPSDPYTFVAPDLEVAALTVFCLSTMYGATSEDGGECVDIFMFGGAAEWYFERFGRDVEAGIGARGKEVAEALCSFMLGHFSDRRRYEAALNAIDDPAKKAAFIAEWQNECSSLNNIGTRAHRLGEKLLAGYAEKAPEPSCEVIVKNAEG